MKIVIVILALGACISIILSIASIFTQKTRFLLRSKSGLANAAIWVLIAAVCFFGIYPLIDENEIAAYKAAQAEKAIKEKAEAEMKAKAIAEEKMKAEAKAKAEAEEKIRAEAKAKAEAEEKARIEAEARKKAELERDQQLALERERLEFARKEQERAEAERQAAEKKRRAEEKKNLPKIQKAMRRELGELYKELMDIREDPRFYTMGFGAGFPWASEWKTRAENLRDRVDQLNGADFDLKLASKDLVILGLDLMRHPEVTERAQSISRGIRAAARLK